MPGSEVDDRRRNKERRNLTWTAFHQVAMLAFDYVEPADTAADIDAAAFPELRALRETGRLHGEFARRQGEEDEASHLLHVPLIDEVQRIKIGDFSRDLACEPFGVEMGNLADAVRAGLDSLKEASGVTSDYSTLNCSQIIS